MEDFIRDSYPFEKIDNNPEKTKYEFISIGTNKIPKRVSITKYPQPGLEKYYNLGFGNISVNSNGIETISDMDRNNNADGDRVLKTVITCALDFMSDIPDAILTFFGNTPAKHRFYKMQMNNNFNSIKSYFIIKGAVIKDLKITTDNEGRKFPESEISVDNIIYEDYNIKHSPFYNFITFELNFQLK